MNDQQEPIRIEDAGHTVRWDYGSVTASVTFAEPIRTATLLVDPPSVLVVESFATAPTNAGIFNIDGTERVRVRPPEVRDAIGFYQAFESPTRLVVVFSTRLADLQGDLNPNTGELTNIRPWR